MNLSLQGIRVIELTTMITGSLAGMMLADLGADVIKVERPGGGDPFRAHRGAGMSPYFLAYNRNKRSIVLDLTREHSRQVFETMLDEADVLIENFRPGVLARLGYESALLRERWPRLVVCSITGFGPDGPKAKEPAYDAVAQAASGLSSLFLTDPPILTGPSLSDNVTGIFASHGILAALLHRERTGEAQHVSTNMLDSSIYLTPDSFLQNTLLGVPAGPLMRVQASQSYVVKCSDGRLVSIHLSSQEKFWNALCAALHQESWRTDPRFDTREKRIDGYLSFAAELQSVCDALTSEALCSSLLASDIPHSLVKSLPEVLQDDQVRHLGTFERVELPDGRSYVAARLPVAFDGTRENQPLVIAPDLNEHGDQIVSDLDIDSDIRTAWLEEIQGKD